MDTQLDLNLERSLYRDQVLALTILVLGYSLFVISARQYATLDWYTWLIGSRIFMVSISFVSLFLVLRWKKSIRNLDAILFTFGLFFQATHGYLEGPDKTDFTLFVGILYAISSLTVRATFKTWTTKIFPIQLILLSAPVLSKDEIFFSSLGKFVDTFSLPIAGLLVGSLIARINSLRFEAMTTIISLERQLKAEKEDRLKVVSIELEKAKAEIQRTAELRTLAEISQQVAHDIRSPLSALNTVLDGLSGLPTEEREIIQMASQRMNDIAGQLLEKARVGNLSIKAASSSGPVNLGPTVAAVVKEKQVEFAQRSDLGILSRVDNALDIFVHANLVELQRAISNLVNNSVEAISGAGQIEISLRKDSSFAFIEIQDSGKGIPKEFLALVGTLGFSFGKNSTQSGSGLGLYHAKRLAEEAGGKLFVDSEVGRGTKVSLALPIASL